MEYLTGFKGYNANSDKWLNLKQLKNAPECGTKNRSYQSHILCEGLLFCLPGSMDSMYVNYIPTKISSLVYKPVPPLTSSPPLESFPFAFIIFTMPGQSRITVELSE